jgi:hypothetical protein
MEEGTPTRKRKKFVPAQEGETRSQKDKNVNYQEESENEEIIEERTPNSTEKTSQIQQFISFEDDELNDVEEESFCVKFMASSII